MIKKKDEFKQIIGKTIKGIIFTEDIPSSPYNQAFILFDDGTYFEIFGTYFQGTSGVVRGNVEDALDYARKFTDKITVIQK